MAEISIRPIKGGECFWCGKPAVAIVGGEYEVCGGPDCLEFALDKAQGDQNYYERRKNSVHMAWLGGLAK